MNSFSIIICTYNPIQLLLQRLLHAIAEFKKSDINHEVIIIDNNSLPALSENKDVRLFLSQQKNAKLINQPIPGLTPSRIEGIRHAKYDWLIFFDDDNEPANDYLLKSQSAIQQYPQTGVWGPGHICVEYTDAVTDWLQAKKHLFQERSQSVTCFKHEMRWQECYPFGTGMVIKKEIANEYARRFDNSRYTLSDRRGKNLSSGGDVQMVLTGIEMGYQAGVFPSLHLKHLIDKSKANLAYLQKQVYGTSSAYIQAFNQVFPKQPISLLTISNLDIIKKTYTLYRIYWINTNSIDFKLLVASVFGELNAVIVASGQPKPLLLRLYERLIHA